jgi:formylglycine-generating enzyme required for sulfatase activity
MNKPLKIFLASSAELENDRREFEIFISRKNKTLHNRGLSIELVMWEDFIDAMSRTRLQDEYNKAVEECDIFVMLFATKVGQFTREEFETAFGKFQKSKTPWIYTYFKKVKADFDEIPREDIESVWDFKDRLKNLGHFWTKYDNIDGLTNHFYGQMEKYVEKYGLFSDTPQPLQEVSEKQIIQDYCQKIKQQFSTINLFGERNSKSKEKRNVFDRMSNIDCGFVPLHLQDWSDEKDKRERLPLEISDLFLSDDLQEKHFLLRGLPGSGKTTLLRYLTYHFACIGVNGEKDSIPVYMRCKELNEEVNKNISLEKFVKRHINANCDDKTCNATLTAEKYFLESPMILLFDGLDEIEDKEVSESISHNLCELKSDYPRCKIIVSSRPIKLERKDFPLFRHLDVLPLESEMIEDYLNRWFEGNRTKINALIHTFKDRPRIKALAGNPFLLSMICFTYGKEGDSALIQKRSDLYKNCTKYLLQRRYDRSNISNSEEDYKKALAILKDLSLRFFLWQESDFPVDYVNVIGKRILTAEEIGKTAGFLDDVERKTGLIQRAKEGFTFVHRSLWEYFTALALKDKKLDFIIKHAADPDWEEVVRLYAGLLPEKERIESLVRKLWNINRPLALRVTTEINISAKDLIKPLIEKEESNQSKLLLIDSLEQSLPLIPQEEQKSLLEETLNILLMECEEKDCQVIYYAQQLLEKKQMGPLEPGGLIYRLFDLENAAKRQQEFLQDPANCFEWIEIEGATFLMGDDDGPYENERPAHQVKVSSFFMTKHQVTNRLLSSFPFGEKYPDYRGATGRHPAIGNTWWEAYYFALWLESRLPTEAEWEYAARSGHKSPLEEDKGDVHIGKYKYAGSNNLDEVGWYNGNSEGKAHPVATKNPNELGLYDMSGNVLEWCSDWYGEEYYDECKKQGIVEDPGGPKTGSNRVLRGGSWYGNAQDCRCAFRHYDSPAARGNSIGFRLVFVP